MSVIIRLQGLPWTANALDIRRYFQGLTIPEGGVHIVGGELGDAFIAFSTDEDARCAMLIDSGRIKDAKVKLLLSSRAEMQKVIEAARNRNLAMQGLLTQNQGPSVTQAGATAAALPQVIHQVPGVGNLVMPAALQMAHLTDPLVQQMYRGLLPMQGQQFPMQMASASLELQQNDMRHVAALQGVQQMQPMLVEQAAGGGAPISYEPTKKSGSNERSDRESRRDRDRERRSRSSRSPRRRSRDRDRDGRVRDRQRRSGSRDTGDRQKFAPRRSSMESYSGGGGGSHPRDIDNRRGAGPVDNVGMGAGQQRSLQNMGRTGGADDGRRFSEPAQSMNSESRDLQPFARKDGQQYSDRWGDGGKGMVLDRDMAMLGRGGAMSDRPDQRGPWNQDHMMAQQRGPMPGDRPSGGMFAGPLGSRYPCCIIVRGIPFNTHPRMIRDFFAGLSIPPDGVRLLFDDRGNRPHLAFVRFSNERDRDTVLKHPTQSFQDGLVEVLPCTEEEFERIPVLPPADDGGVSARSEPAWNQPSSRQPRSPPAAAAEETCCVLMKGLSFKCFREDIVKFFDGYRVVDVMIMLSRPGRVAFVEFPSAAEARRALSLNGKKLDYRTMELSLCTKDAMISAKHHGIENMNNSNNVSNVGDGSNNSGVRVTVDRSGNPLADAGSDQGRAPVATRVGGGAFNNGPQNRIGDDQIFDCCLIVGLPFSATDHDIIDFLAPTEVVPVAIHIMLDGNGRPVGDAFCEFASPHDCYVAVQRDGFPLRPDSRFVLKMRPVTRRELEDALGIAPVNPSQNGGEGPGSMMHSPPSSGHHRGPFDMHGGGPSPPMRGGGPMMHLDRGMMDHPLRQGSPMHRPGGEGVKLGQPGCVVDVQNIPYRATYDDILRHFKGYGLTRDRILRRYTDNGLPTGDARLFFSNPKEAQSAIRQFNHQTFFGRSMAMHVVRDVM